MDKAEVLSLIEAYLAQSNKTFALEDLCFDKQLEFIRDAHRFKTACCGGRAGKTVAAAAYLFHSAQLKPGSVSLYITLTRLNAKKLVWPELLKIKEQFNLTCKVNESDMSIRLPNGSFIYASGADKKQEIEKFRGLPLGLCIIDEVQSFKSYIQELIDDVITKRLFDYSGTLALTGTPGPVPVGYFYDACQSPTYQHFHWTMFDNPWIEKKSGRKPQALLQDELNRKGVDIHDASIQREVFGKWVLDSNALVFRYDAVRNHFDKRDLPTLIPNPSFVIGVDLGYDDADAISVIGWGTGSSKAYLVEELVTKKQGITELAKDIDRLVRRYNPLRVVMDTGGLGKKIAEEIQKRYTIAVTAAEKQRKFEFIELLNDALRTGNFYADKDGDFAYDCGKVEWDRDSVEPKIKDTYHSDIADSTLYAYREALHWLYEAPIPQPKQGTDAWFQKEVEEMEEAAKNTMNITTVQDGWDEW